LEKRLKDLRTVLDFLEGRGDFDADRPGLWVGSFPPANSLICRSISMRIGLEVRAEFRLEFS
jgi:hypothetical protein